MEHAASLSAEALRDGRAVILRCAAGAGFAARLKRCLELAMVLRAQRGIQSIFALDSAEAANEVRAAGFGLKRRPDGTPEAVWLETLWALSGAGALVLDAERSVPDDDGQAIEQADIARWRRAGLVILTLDDHSARRLSVDIAAYPDGSAAREMSWFGFRGELLCGAEWAMTGGHAVARLCAMLASRMAPMAVRATA